MPVPFCPKEGMIMKNVVKFLIIFAIIVISVIIIKKDKDELDGK